MDYKRASRAHMKRQLLDKLDAAHTFALPEGMVEQEFNAVWNAVTGELKREGKTFADEGKSEDELKKEYRAISERRVRLGLVLAELGRLNNLTVSQEEMTRAVSARARQFPGQEKKVFEFYQKNPQAQAEIRAPIFEDKVVDFIFELAKTKDVKISKEDLFTDPDDLIEKRKKGG
jgi:trigger factor